MITFNFTANNTSSAAINTNGGTHVMMATGTFGSGTVTLEYSPDNGTTWITTGVTRTAAGMGNVVVPRGKLRMTISGATTPNVNAWLSSPVLQ